MTHPYGPARRPPSTSSTRCPTLHPVHPLNCLCLPCRGHRARPPSITPIHDSSTLTQPVPPPQGKTLIDQLDAIYTEYGYHASYGSYFICKSQPTIDEIFGAIREVTEGSNTALRRRRGSVVVLRGCCGGGAVVLVVVVL